MYDEEAGTFKAISRMNLEFRFSAAIWAVLGALAVTGPPLSLFSNGLCVYTIPGNRFYGGGLNPVPKRGLQQHLSRHSPGTSVRERHGLSAAAFREISQTILCTASSSPHQSSQPTLVHSCGIQDLRTASTLTWMASSSAILNFQHNACRRNYYLPSSLRSQPTGNEVEEGRGEQEPSWMGRLLRSVLRFWVSLSALFRSLKEKSHLKLSSYGIMKKFHSMKTPLIVGLLVLWAFWKADPTFLRREPKPVEVSMSEFMKITNKSTREGRRAKRRIQNLIVSQDGMLGFDLDGKRSFTRQVKVSDPLTKHLADNGVQYGAAPQVSHKLKFLPNLLPAVIYLWYIKAIIKMRGPGGDTVGTAGRRAASNMIDTSLTFDDVMGIEGPKREVEEIVSMLRDPAPYVSAGARLPSGVLLTGPPGTGKTLLARCMASEAGVPFWFCSGSEFNEIYVGRGAARIRKLFEQAERSSPSIVFIDELDTVGRARFSGESMRGGHEEAEQTLNQLLTCMDGLDKNKKSGVLVVAATNRLDLLDKALTRPGRFDRLVKVAAPDLVGREKILEVHTRDMELSDKKRTLTAVASMTSGLAGADLAGICNESAIRAVRRGSNIVSANDFLLALESFKSSRKDELPW